MDTELQQILSILNIEQIPKERNYWLIRTESGKFYFDFLENNYVSIGWDEFSDINIFKNTEEKKLKEHIASVYKDEKRPGYIYNQIKRFMFDIKKGDMILIPSENSSQIAFGIVQETFFIRDTINNNTTNLKIPKCNFKKCIKVEWKSKIFKEKFDPYLKMLLFTHTTITDINDYKGYINRLLYSNYILDDMIHVTFNITTKDNINAVELLNFLNLISKESIDVFNQVTGSDFKKDTVDVKLNVQSPGPIEFIGYAIGGILVISIINAFLFGIKLDVELFKIVKFNIDNEGLITYIFKFIQEKNANNQSIAKLKNNFKISKEKLKIQQSEKLLYAPKSEEKNNSNSIKKVDSTYEQISLDTTNNSN